MRKFKAIIPVFLEILLCLVLICTFPGAGVLANGGGETQNIFIPLVVSGQEDGDLEKTVLQALAGAYPADRGFSPYIKETVQNAEWAVVIAGLGVAMEQEDELANSVFVLARRENDHWQVILMGDALWNSWIEAMPQDVMHPSLREYLLDQAAASQPDAAVNLPDLKLPWRPADNPRSISGYLYNEGTHKNGDSFAMDWGLRHNTVVAAAGGTIVGMVCDLPDVRNDAKGYGNYVLMDMGGNVFALYGHLSSCDGGISISQYVPQGRVLGVSGTSGYSTGPHLHFRLRDGQHNPVLAEPISGYDSIKKGALYSSNNAEDSGPGPSCDPSADQIAVYVDGDYKGQCVRLGLGQYANPGSMGLANDSISSIKVGGNVKAVLCRDDNYGGGCEDFWGSDDNLGNNAVGNDQVSSIKVETRTGSLQVVEALVLSNTSPAAGDVVRARFRVRNVGGQAIVVEGLAAGARLGQDWNGEWADFGLSSFTLQPGQEFQYDQQRSFEKPGSYFAEPVAKINGQWGGISMANRVNFTVGAMGRLEVVEPLTLTNTYPAFGEVVQARFKVRNVGSRPILIDQLTAGGRRGTGWDGEWADFPGVSNITLQPGQEYIYQQSRMFGQEGGYFSEPVAKLQGNWGGIASANRVNFQVQAGGKLQVVGALTLSNTTPGTVEQVQARFRVKNVGSTALQIEQLTAGGRRGADWDGEWADFPGVSNITLQPGEEYQYDQKHLFMITGDYFAEPVVKLYGNWGGINSANRVRFTVTQGLYLSEPLRLNPTPVRRNQEVTATFKIRNASSRAISIYRLVAGGRGPHCYDLTCSNWADFPTTPENITLQPGQEYAYSQSTVCTSIGPDFVVIPVIEVTPGYWEIVPGAGYTHYEVLEGGRLEISSPLVLSTTQPAAGQEVVARFTARNTGTQPLHIDQLVAGGRRGSTWDDVWADFPSVFDIDLAPGQTYQYEQVGVFTVPGGYFAEPTARFDDRWSGISGANRVTFTVVQAAADIAAVIASKHGDLE